MFFTQELGTCIILHNLKKPFTDKQTCCILSFSSDWPRMTKLWHSLPHLMRNENIKISYIISAETHISVAQSKCYAIWLYMYIKYYLPQETVTTAFFLVSWEYIFNNCDSTTELKFISNADLMTKKMILKMLYLLLLQQVSLYLGAFLCPFL